MKQVKLAFLVRRHDSDEVKVFHDHAACAVVAQLPRYYTTANVNQFLSANAATIKRFMHKCARLEQDWLEFGDVVYVKGVAFTLVEGEMEAIDEERRVMTIPRSDHNLASHVDVYMSEVFSDEVYVLVKAAAKDVGVNVNKVIFTGARHYWGCCKKGTGQISISVRLFRYPPEVIRAVIYHELVHLIHPNHSPQFHQLLGKFIDESVMAPLKDRVYG